MKNKRYEKLLNRAQLYAIEIVKYERLAKDNPLLATYLERLRARGEKILERTERARDAQ